MGSRGIVWVDVLTPKQFWFFTVLEEALRSRGCEVLVTARRYEQLTPLLEYSGRGDVIVVGEYGGGSLAGKLEASLRRGVELLRVVEQKTPSLVISSGSPEAARIAYGLGIPHILVSDTPESPVNKLTAPISELVFTPWVVGYRPWTRYGVARGSVRLYRGLDPLAWIGKTIGIDGALERYGLERSRYVLVRSPEFKAAYLGTGYVREYMRMLRMLRDVVDDFRLVILPRYSDETELVRSEVGEAVVVEKPVYGSSILAGAAVFVGGGGTMTQEAALLGIPTISTYPKQLPAVLRYLWRKKLIAKAGDAEKLVRIVRRYLENLDEITREKMNLASEIKHELVNPVEFIVNRLSEEGFIS